MTHQASTRHVATRNQGVSCSQHLKSSGLPLNPMVLTVISRFWEIHPSSLVSQNLPILLANLLQSSRSTFSGASSPSFFAFKEGIWDPQISALLRSPTVFPPPCES